MKEHYGDSYKDHTYFQHSRRDVVDVLLEYFEKKGVSPKNLLEIGSGSGATGSILKKAFPQVHYSGFELMSGPAQKSTQLLDHVVCGDIEEMLENSPKLGIENREYDAILFLDVLEHLRDPWNVLEKLSVLLKPGGIVVGSIPNSGHFYVLSKLLFDKFEYDEAGGLLDSTHLRFFTLHSILKMLENQFVLKNMVYKYSSFSEYSLMKRIFFKALKAFFPKTMVVQYIFIAEKKSPDER